MFFPNGDAIRLYRTRTGRIERFFWNGKRHRVEEVVRTWRVADEWWQEGVTRDCYKLVTDTGLLLILYQEQDAWFVQRVYD